MEQMLRHAGFSQARCVIEASKGEGWLCALGIA
jgi:hypothetical protein